MTNNTKNILINMLNEIYTLNSELPVYMTTYLIAKPQVVLDMFIISILFLYNKYITCNSI